jgi:hypothetical protein
MMCILVLPKMRYINNTLKRSVKRFYGVVPRQSARFRSLRVILVTQTVAKCSMGREGHRGFTMTNRGILERDAGRDGKSGVPRWRPLARDSAWAVGWL